MHKFKCGRNVKKEAIDTRRKLFMVLLGNHNYLYEQYNGCIPYRYTVYRTRNSYKVPYIVMSQAIIDKDTGVNLIELCQGSKKKKQLRQTLLGGPLFVNVPVHVYR